MRNGLIIRVGEKGEGLAEASTEVNMDVRHSPHSGQPNRAPRKGGKMGKAQSLVRAVVLGGGYSVFF